MSEKERKKQKLSHVVTKIVFTLRKPVRCNSAGRDFKREAVLNRSHIELVPLKAFFRTCQQVLMKAGR